MASNLVMTDKLTIQSAVSFGHIAKTSHNRTWFWQRKALVVSWRSGQRVFANSVLRTMFNDSVFPTAWPMLRPAGWPILRLAGWPMLRLAGWPILRPTGWPPLRPAGWCILFKACHLTHIEACSLTHTEACRLTHIEACRLTPLLQSLCTYSPIC